MTRRLYRLKIDNGPIYKPTLCDFESMREVRKFLAESELGDELELFVYDVVPVCRRKITGTGEYHTRKYRIAKEPRP